MLIPKHIQIEPINGVCTARCTMCGWKEWTRKPNVMTNDDFRKILEKFYPYRNDIQWVTLHFCAEPLLDKQLGTKVRIASEMGFKSIGFATNCTELNEDKSRELVAAGLDTIICSIDGTNKATHESIRVGTNFEEVVANVKNFIKVRNESGRTKILIRFIYQKTNRRQWEAFYDYWSQLLNKDFGDDVVKFDVHNWGGKLDGFQTEDMEPDTQLYNHLCEDVFERMSIYSNGDVALCCADDNGFYELGNAIDSDPIDIYNGEAFDRHRKKMEEGKISELEHCKTCAIPRSRELQRGRYIPQPLIVSENSLR